MERNWNGIQESQAFRTLMARKRRFIVPATVFFVVYYFLLPVLNGYFKDFMATKVIGSLNIAYLFALSQFFMAWVLAYLYVRAANQFDQLAEQVRREAGPEKTIKAN